jgi:hypothetical protein
LRNGSTDVTGFGFGEFVPALAGGRVEAVDIAAIHRRHELAADEQALARPFDGFDCRLHINCPAFQIHSRRLGGAS